MNKHVKTVFPPKKKSYDVQRLAADEGSEVARVVVEDQVEVPEMFNPPSLKMHEINYPENPVKKTT